MQQIDYSYLRHTVNNIQHALKLDSPNTGKLAKDEILVSIHIQSNRPESFTSFLDCIEETVVDHSLVEVVVKIDDTDEAMNELLPKEISKRPFTVKYIATPLVGGFFELWRSMNDMLKVCNPKAYFLLNTSDELRILNKGWDQAIKHYVRLFPDDLYRLRSSAQFRFRNYSDYWECGFAPETLAFNTQKWIRVGGNWNPCLGPDTFQQCVAYYYNYNDRFYKHRPVREVPINEMICDGEEAYVGMEGEKLHKRLQGAFKAWYRLMSYEVQNDASRRSQKIYAHASAYDKQIHRFELKDDGRDVILINSDTNKIAGRFPYALSRIGVFMKNSYRLFNYYYYAGGGYVERKRIFIERMIRLVFTNFPSLYKSKLFKYIKRIIKALPRLRSYIAAWYAKNAFSQHIVKSFYLFSTLKWVRLTKGIFKTLREYLSYRNEPNWNKFFDLYKPELVLEECLKRISTNNIGNNNYKVEELIKDSKKAS